MATPSRRTLLTDRDRDVLAALDRCPLTIEQLRKVSVTFCEQFSSDSRVRGRLTALREAGWVNRWSYATSSKGGAPDYYKLTLAGYRLLYGPEALPLTKRSFTEVGLAHQHHTRSLADFIVHTTIAATARGLSLDEFCRENTLRLPIGDESLFPDCAFSLRLAGQQWNFVVELDNGTERIRSQKDSDSWERKIRLYDAFQDGLEHRLRVLVVTTRSSDRLQHILDAAAELTKNPQRSLFYGIHLGEFLAESDATSVPCFLDHRGRPVSLVPVQQELPMPSRSMIGNGLPQPVCV